MTSAQSTPRRVLNTATPTNSSDPKPAKRPKPGTAKARMRETALGLVEDPTKRAKDRAVFLGPDVPPRRVLTDFLEEHGEIGASIDDMAGILKLEPHVIAEYLNRYPEARIAYEAGLARMRIVLRKRMLSLAATQSNAATFLAKNVLGMKDQTDQVVTTRRDVSEVSDEELEEIVKRGSSSPAPEVSHG